MSISMKWALAGAAIALCAGAWWWMGDREVERSIEEPLADARPAELREAQAAYPVGKGREALGGGEVASLEPAVASVAEPEESAELETALDPPPPGTIELLVLRAGQPAAGCWVHFQARLGYWLPRDPWKEGTGVEHLQLDATGRTEIRGLEPGACVLGIELSPGIVKHRRAEIPKETGTRVVIELGTGEISGRVYDASGGAVAGARVDVSGGASSGPGVRSIVWTGADGGYSVTELPKGHFGLSLNLDGGWDTTGSDESAKVVLEEGERRVFDFGSPVGTATWSGHVRGQTGAAVQKSIRIVLVERTSGSVLVPWCADDGSFSISAPPGEYRVHLFSPSNSSESISVFEDLKIDSADLQRDILLPGARIAGRVTGSADRMASLTRHRRWVSIHEKGHDYPAAFGHVDLLADGTFAFDAIKAGTWLVSVSGAEPESLEVEVLESDALLEVEFTLR